MIRSDKNFAKKHSHSPHKGNVIIWFKDYTIEEVKSLISNESMSDQLGIEFIEVGKDYLKARMPVDKRTCQPFGMLHGGATCVLAETIGSIASLMSVNLKQKYEIGRAHV